MEAVRITPFIIDESIWCLVVAMEAKFKIERQQRAIFSSTIFIPDFAKLIIFFYSSPLYLEFIFR